MMLIGAIIFLIYEITSVLLTSEIREVVKTDAETFYKTQPTRNATIKRILSILALWLASLIYVIWTITGAIIESSTIRFLYIGLIIISILRVTLFKYLQNKITNPSYKADIFWDRLDSMLCYLILSWIIILYIK